VVCLPTFFVAGAICHHPAALVMARPALEIRSRDGIE
jgi:uncharacterized protein (DUF305 family)